MEAIECRVGPRARSRGSTSLQAAVESSRPGELLNQDTYFARHLKGVRQSRPTRGVYTTGSFAFGFLHASKQLATIVAVLHNEVLPGRAASERRFHRSSTDR